MKSKVAISLLAAATVFTALNASVVDDVKELMDGGDYTAAAEVIRASLDKSPGGPHAAALNQLLGECLFEEKDYEGARQHFKTARAKGVADAWRYLGRLDYLDYDFAGASANYAKYRQLRSKHIDTDDSNFDTEEKQLSQAKEYLQRIEKIAVLDSITVGTDDFFTHYRLPSSAGSLNKPETLPIEESRDLAGVVFANEGHDFMMWAEPDTLGVLRIVESEKLTDGSWHAPVVSGVNREINADADYPFMMPDGLTLYYASNGEGSIGGYDIFVASRDAATGEYLQPQNIGMPYNSPYDDFMLAIDEANGIGWWTTDRNNIPGKLTVYVYAINDVRKNYTEEDGEDNVSFARIDNIADTRGDEDYSELIQRIGEIVPGKAPRKADFHFPMPGGKIYTQLSDFKNEGARRAMQEYLKAKKILDTTDAELTAARRSYRDAPSQSLKSKIIRLEADIEVARESLRRFRNNVYRAAGASK